MMAILQIVVLVLGMQAQPVPVIVVDGDDTVIDRSSVVRIDPDSVLRDANNNGVIHIAADGITVEFEEGSVLRGASGEAAPDGMHGIGISIKGHRDVTIHNARLEGFKVGIHAEDAPGLRIEGVEVSNMFRQRLGSKPWAEDDTDRLDVDQSSFWVARYGAAVAVVDSDNVTIRDVKVRESQNGIVLKGVHGSRIYDNDSSFLSGWGLAMSRSGGNVVSRNAFDFCVRGYSHGQYNVDHGSAGIVVLGEGDNTFAENSVSHSGAGMLLRGEGNSIIVGSEFSYAATSGVRIEGAGAVELVENRFTGNAAAGVHVREAAAVVLTGNTFSDNGAAAVSGTEGGIVVDGESMIRLTGNTFQRNTAGIHLTKESESAHITITANTFEGDKVGLRVEGHEREAAGEIIFIENTMTDVEIEQDLAGGVTLTTGPPAFMPEDRPDVEAPGTRQPVGAREDLAGRENIILTRWGPWDHGAQAVRQLYRSGRYHMYQVLNVDGKHVRPFINDLLTDRKPMRHEAGKWAVTFAAPWKGVIPYKLVIDHPEFERVIAGALVHTTWEVAFFPWSRQSDPDALRDPHAWRNLAERPDAIRIETDSIDFLFGSGGPGELRHPPYPAELSEAEVGRESFGMVARTTVPLQSGVYRVRTYADDGVRVTVDGRTIIDRWVLRGPDASMIFTVDGEREVEIMVEYYKAGGRGILRFDLEPAFLDNLRVPQE